MSVVLRDCVELGVEEALGVRVDDLDEESLGVPVMLTDCVLLRVLDTEGVFVLDAVSVALGLLVWLGL